LAKVTLDSFTDDAAYKDQWTVDAEPVQKIVKLTGSDATDIPELLAGTTFPDAQAQQTDALL
jgi:taurine transport system substrate-binding protein